MGNLVFEAASGGSTTISGPNTTGSNTITIPNASGTFALTNTPVTTATNLAGGATGSVPYQSGTSSTTFLAAGSNGQVLTLAAGVPTWSTVSGTGDVVGPASATNNAIATYNGTTGKLIQNSGATISAGVITASGFTGTASSATNIAGGATGSVPYQSSTGSTTFLAAGSNGQVLTLSSGVPTWAAVSGTGTVTNVSALTLGTTGTDLSSTVANSTTTPVITLNVPTASATNRGVLSSADWTTFNNKGSGTVTSVTGTAPVVSSGGTTPAISMAAASTSVSGYLTSTDWNTFNGKGSGTVTSVGGTGTVNGLTLTGTVTTSGNLTLGGTLNLSAPPAIGGTTAAAITGTTITASTNFVGSNFDASGSGGGSLRSSSSAACLQWGAAGGVNLTLNGAFNMNPANATISIAPTGTGTLTVNPATAGTIDNMSLGATTAAAAKVTTLNIQTGLTLATLSGTSGQVLTSAGAGAVPTWTTPTGTVYPGAGIPNSTGSAWGTSYSTSGTGSSVALANNATLITFTGTGIKETSTVISASNIDMNAGNYFTKTISGTTTFTISNAASSGTVNSFILQLTNGGSATVNWFSGVKWAGGTAPTLTASGYDDLGFFTIDGGTTWQGFVLGKAMA
jgi:hypothetical protein